MLESLMKDTEQIWQDTGLDSKDPSYLIEKTMRFELAHNTILKLLDTFREIIENYKKLCIELETQEE